MGSPKFRVGEEVVLCFSDVRLAGFNGQICVVTEILSRTQRDEEHQQAVHRKFKSMFFQVESLDMPYYRLAGFSRELLGEETGPLGVFTDLAAESSLRRHHKPATRSWEQLLADPGRPISA